jgi:hypothetical protein
MAEPIKLPSHGELDALVDTDPIRLRDEAYAMRAEVERLNAELAEMESAAADWAARLAAQKDRADRSANRTRSLMRTAIRRVGELGTLRDAVADSDPIRAERLTFAIEEIRALFKREPDGGETS